MFPLGDFSESFKVSHLMRSMLEFKVMPNARLYVQPPGLLWEQVDDEFVVYDQSTNQVHLLSQLHFRVLQAEHDSFETLAEEFFGDSSPHEATSALHEIQHQLCEKKLLMPQEAGVTRRQFIKKGTLVASLPAVISICTPIPAAADSLGTFVFSSSDPSVSVPAKANSIIYENIAGGGGGGGRGRGGGAARGGHGSMGQTVTGTLAVTGGGTINVVVGTGGLRGARPTTGAGGTGGAGGAGGSPSGNTGGSGTNGSGTGRGGAGGGGSGGSSSIDGSGVAQGGTGGGGGGGGVPGGAGGIGTAGTNGEFGGGGGAGFDGPGPNDGGNGGNGAAGNNAARGPNAPGRGGRRERDGRDGQVTVTFCV
jgi:hypothetical protein